MVSNARRKMVANILRTLGETGTRIHDAYKEFFSENKWEQDKISKIFFMLLLTKLLTSGWKSHITN